MSNRGGPDLSRRQMLATTALVAGIQAAGATAALPLAEPTLEDAFRSPPLSAGPWVYWMWLDGNVTPESVAIDLQAMHDVGIAGAYVLDVLQGTPPGPARYMDDSWQAAFRAAVQTARRLGMQIIFNQGAGYYGSGGPWITPELSMQILVQSETPVIGGRQVVVALPRPPVPSDDAPASPWYANDPFTKRFGHPGADYRDIAVIAVREPASERATMADATPQVHVGGNTVPLPTSEKPLVLADGMTMTIRFSAPYRATAAGVTMADVKGALRVTIAVEVEGAWHDLGTFPFASENARQAIAFAPIIARTYRLTFLLGANASAELHAIDLHARTRVADATGMKLLTWYEWNGYTGAGSAPLDATLPYGARAIPLTDVIDLTAKAKDGSLTWDAPAGDWTVFRIGHGGKGRIIGPVSEDKAGLESDKLSLAATELHFDAMVRPLMKAVGPAGRGTVRGTHIDSWEGGGQNWTPKFREEFRRRRGYDPVAWLPIVTGRRVLGDLHTTERFMWDLRRTVSELSVENYWAPMKRLSNSMGLALSAESYTSISNDMDASDFADEPMAEFWKHTGEGFNGFGNTCKAMASAAHLNGRAIVAAEAFTSIDTERWQDHPGTLKVIGDRNLAKGINRFVFHRYSAQRFPGIAPGLQMGPWGLHYERTQTWWTMSRPWHVYLARCQHLLRKGRSVADILRLPSEEPLLRVEDKPVEGFDYDHCGPDMFAQAKVEDGVVRFPSGAAYKLIVLDHLGTMTFATLRIIAALVRGGAAVLGEPPRATPGLTQREKADRKLAALALDMWGDGSTLDRGYGKGRVFRGMPAQDALARLGIAPDFESDVPLNWVHRRDGDRDVYFVASEAPQPVLANLTLRAAGRCALWDAESGRITAWPYATPGVDGRTRLSVPLAAEGSLFVIVQPGEGERIDAVECDGATLFRDGVGQASLAPLLAPSPAPPAAGRYVVRRSNGTTARAIAAPATPQSVQGPWVVSFPSKTGAPARTTMAMLRSLHEDRDPGIAHFAGIANYRTSFAVKPVMAGQRLWLDLGRVAVAARVLLNGHDLGILWRAPYAIDVTDAVRSGDNQLEIEVATLWINRLIGDEELPSDAERWEAGPGVNSRNIGSLKTWPQWVIDGKPSPTGRIAFSTWRLYRKGEPLVPSGLIGPVRIVTGVTPLA
ncbi:glycosyl hydrolase [Sphingomonas faeni]|uniref:glycosyl hydrolase n=1 Tax=Sphingomonas faeni TaxID=185950 RepID=UPI00334756C0